MVTSRGRNNGLSAHTKIFAILCLVFPLCVSKHASYAGIYISPQIGIADDYAKHVPNITSPQEIPFASSDKILSDLNALRGIGAKYLRFGISWLWIEQQQGNYTWDDWDNFVGDVVYY